MTFRRELIDELLQYYCNPADLMGEDGIFKQLSKPRTMFKRRTEYPSRRRAQKSGVARYLTSRHNVLLASVVALTLLIH
jgi:hypothetical protein